jgi:predicted HAD superfamily Cof-like phosphohydrolase
MPTAFDYECPKCGAPPGKGCVGHEHSPRVHTERQRYESPSTLSRIFGRLGIRGKVIAFHEAMGVPVKEVPAVPEQDRVRLRLSLIAEEFFETMAAALGEVHVCYAKTLVMAAIKHVTPQVNMVEFTDGLCDLDYVVEGTRLEFGIDGGPVLEEVHAANMRKTDGPIREDGKRLKPPGWVGPDIERVLREQRWQG